MYSAPSYMVTSIVESTSKHDRPMCEFESGQHKSLTPDPSSDDDARGQQDDKEAEIADEEEGFGGDSERDILPYLDPTKKRSLCRVKEKPHKKRVSSATPSRHDYIQMPKRGRATSQTSAAIHLPNPTTSPNLDPLLPILTSLQGDTSDDGAMDLAGGGSQMAVIYEQQSWKGKIVQERDVKKGRPRKQYLVRWEQS